MHLDEEDVESISTALTLSQGITTAVAAPPHPLEPIKSITPSEGATSFAHDERPPAFGPVWKEILIVGLCCCGPITQTLPSTSILVGLAVVARDFDLAQGETAWIMTAVMLSSGSFLLLGGRLADLYGRKLILVISFLVSAIWSIIAGFSHSKYLFFVARGFQGLAAAGAIPASLGILGANYGPGKRKNKVFAAFSAGNPVGAAFGLVLGGVFTSFVSWRWMMWIFGIFMVIVTITSVFMLPKDIKKPGRRERIDFLGAFLVTAGLILLCFGLTDASNAPEGWKTWYIIFCLVLGVVLCVLFVFVESKVPNPLMPLSIWRVPQFGKLMVAFGLGFGAFGGSVIFGYSLYFQQIYQASPITTTLYFIPQFLSGLMTNIVVAFLLHLVPGNILLAIGMACYAIACILGALQPLGLTYWAMSFPAMRISLLQTLKLTKVIGVIGADVSYLVASLFALTHVEESQQSIASGIVGTASGIFSSIFSAVSAALLSNIGGNQIENTTPTQAELEQLIKGFQAQFWLGFAAAVIAALLALTLRLGKRGTRDEIRQSQLAKKAEQEKHAAEYHSSESQESESHTETSTS